MQLIIVDARRGITRRIDTNTVRTKTVAVMAGAVVFVLLAGLLSAGWKLHGWLQPQQAEILNVSAPDLAEQRAAIDALRARMHEDSAAFARRIASLQAHVARIDAAGERMTSLAGLDEGEFDFASQPAIGGPIVDEDRDPVSLADIADELDALDARIRDRARQISVLEDLLVASRVRSESQPEGAPVTSGYISSGYGRRTDPFTGRASSHFGMDFAARPGTDVAAVGSGIVEFSGLRNAYGNMIEINHGNGYATRYGHNRKLLVEVGERVTRGQIIAEVGSSGRATGPHLHFEVWQDGKAVNPMRYIRAAR